MAGPPAYLRIMNPTASHSVHPKYRPDIDGLRALAVLAVVLFHAFPRLLAGGFIGVDIFFVISGYLISTIIFQSLDQGTFSFADFYARRVKRIFPALLVVMTACYALGWFILLGDEYQQLGKHMAAGAGFVSNLALWSEAGYFDNAGEVKPLLHLWSLGIEEQFYLFWPLLLVWGWRRKLNLFSIALLVAGVSFYLNLRGVHRHPVNTFYLPHTRFWELLCGALLAWSTLYRKHALAPQRRWLDAWLVRVVYREPREADGQTLSAALSLAGFGLLGYGFLRVNQNLPFPGVWALLPVTGAVLIILAGPRAWLNRVVLSNRIAVWFGLISFPLYLWHWPLLAFVRIAAGEVAPGKIRLAAILLAVVLAWLTYRLVERPLRFGANGRRKVVVLLLLMGVVGAAGLVTQQRAGFPWRMPQIDENMRQLRYHVPSTASCATDHPYATTSCYESGKGHADSLFMIGDSHMEALMYGFKKLVDSGELPYNVTAIGRSGCAPFINVDSITYEKNSYGCTAVISGALREALRRDDVKWVLLVGRHAARFDGKLFGEMEAQDKPWTYRYDNGASVVTSYAGVYEAGLTETLDLLVKAGKKVVFVDQLPEMGFDPRNCMTQFRQKFISSKCLLPRAVVDARLTPYLSATHKILSRYPGVIEYDPLGLVCSDKDCGPFNDAGMLMYRDDDHMSMVAAEAMARGIFQRMSAGK
jgi:peptidoglycan/LPS O-acetylase OafA/YrhL